MKKIILSALLAVGILPLSAQDSNMEHNQTDATSNFWDNCFVSAGIGAQIYIGDHNKQMKFGDRISFAFDIAAGKWLTEDIGVRLMYSGLPVKGATQNGAHSNGKAISGKPWHGYWLTEQEFNLSNLHADVMFDLVHIIGQQESKWSASPYVGIGWAHVGGSPSADGLSGNFGVIGSYSLNSMLDINLDVRGVLLKDGMDGEKGGTKGEGMVTATIGVSYKF